MLFTRGEYDDEKTWKTYEWLAAVLLIIGVIIIFVTNIAHYNYKMNSDIGAETVLGRLIWGSREIIPSSWYSSTETRIIAIPQVAALFYGMTGDMDSDPVTIRDGLNILEQSMNLLVLTQALLR